MENNIKLSPQYAHALFGQSAKFVDCYTFINTKIRTCVGKLSTLCTGMRTSFIVALSTLDFFSWSSLGSLIVSNICTFYTQNIRLNK